MGRSLLRSLDQFVDDVLWRGAIWITHAEVDDVLAPLARGCLQLTCNVEHIRGQPRQPSELFHACPVNPFAVSLTIQTAQTCTGAGNTLAWNMLRQPLLLCGKHNLHRKRSWRVARGIVASLILQCSVQCMVARCGDNRQCDDEGARVYVELVARIEAEAIRLSCWILEGPGLDSVR